MKISIEWFLADNTLMNLCIFLLASVLSGIRVKPLTLGLFSLGGAVYALAALFYLPLLRKTPVKIGSFLVFGLVLREKGSSIVKASLCVLLSAAVVGGTVIGIALMSGGSVASNGTIVGTLQVRTALLGAVISLMLPRTMRTLLAKRATKETYTTICVRIGTEERKYRALIDTGNLLTEPISGLPIVLLKDAKISPERVVVYQTHTGESVLYAAKPQSLVLTEYGGCEVACYTACAIQQIPNAEAVLPASLIPNIWRRKHETHDPTPMDANPDLAAHRSKKRVLVYSYRGNPPAAARPRRRKTLHRSGSNGEMGKGQTDRP